MKKRFASHVKRLVALCLLVCLASSLVITARAERTLLAHGSCGENITWELFDDGELILAGYGAMTDATADYYVPWFSRRDRVRSVTMSSGITYIGDYAFYGCRLSYLAVPTQITAIGDYAFAECSQLTAMTFPMSVTAIGDHAFSNCPFKWFVISGGVSTVGEFAFSGCDKLSTITISNSVASIGDGAFSGTSLSTVQYLGTLTEWKNIAIGNNNDELTGASVAYLGVGTVPVTSVTLDQTSLTLHEGDSQTLTATVLPADATDYVVAWESSDTAVVTVDDAGAVIAVSAGTATITAKAGGVTAVCTVTVSTPAENIPGDLNHDGAVNVKDVVLLMRFLAGGYGVVLN